MRLDGYIRVSSVGSRDVASESYQTEDIQREKIEGWATQRGVKIARWHVDRDQSGAKLTRPGFDQVMARIEAGETGGVVVAQIDRLSRADVADALMTVRRIHDDFGGTLVALDLGIDPTTEVGEMLLTVLLALARMQWRRYQSAWATTRRRAAERGAQLSAAPLGYRHAENGGGRLEVDPVLGPLVARAFGLAANDGIQSARAFLQEADTGRRWHTPQVRRTLARRVYLGETSWNGVVTQDAHEPLTDLATWTAAQSAGDVRQPRGAFPLSGVLLCGSCGTHMVGTRGKGKRKYRCGSGGGLRKPVECALRAWADADSLEQYLLERVLLEMEHREANPEAHPEVDPAVPAGGSRGVEAAERELRNAELRRDEFAAAELDISPEAWAARARALDGAVESALEAYEAAVDAAGPRRIVGRSDQLRAAGVTGLPAALDRLGLQVRVRAGSNAPMSERIMLRDIER